MSVEVLISCMHQSDWSIIERSNIQTDVLIVNQCDTDAIEKHTFINQSGKTCHARMIHTTERGLSRSRNMALQYATGDICIFCDDDEVFEENYERTILQAFEANPDYAIIAFRLNYNRKTFPQDSCTYNRFTSGRLSSAQIAFEREKILSTGILFDVQLGSGTGNGGGEETKWLYQLLKKRSIKAIYLPILIASIADGESLWFKGYNERYFVNYGWTIRRIYGCIIGTLFLCYHVISHRHLYAAHCSTSTICKHLIKGFFEKR